jgi:hypothetical protein
MHSTTTRLRTAFVPWLAALVIGATAHAGWLIHDLRDHRGTERPRSFTHAIVELDVDLSLELPRHDTRASAMHCRHATRHARREDERRARRELLRRSTSELDSWITRVGTHEYEVDTRMLARVEAGTGADASERLAGLLGVSQGVELRNIQRDTPLWQLGLRTGDRLLAVAREPSGERIELALARRGRPVVLVYRLV